MKVLVKVGVGALISGETYDVKQIKGMNILGIDGMEWYVPFENFEFVKTEVDSQPKATLKEILGQDVKSIEFR